MMSWWLWILLFFLAMALTWCWQQYALWRALLDEPNERSSHTLSTPRGGGIAIVLVFLVGSLWLLRYQGLSVNHFCAAMGGGLGIVGIGLLDDHGHVSPLTRLSVHFIACLGMILFLEGGDLYVGRGDVAAILKLAVALVALVWLVNLYNFMDGIDGIASSEAVCVAFGAMVLLWSRNGPSAQAQWLGVLVVANLGFLWWNWPPAKIFMGDVGSGFLGYIFGFFGILTTLEASINPLSWFILLSVFIADASLTLVRRIIRGERYYEAHRSHGYQRLAQKTGSHRTVTRGVIAVNLLWTLPMAIVATTWPQYSIACAMLTYLPISFFLFFVGAGRTKE